MKNENASQNQYQVNRPGLLDTCIYFTVGESPIGFLSKIIVTIFLRGD